MNYDKHLQPILVTGGAGFIGSNFVLNWLANEKSPVINLDKLSYAGNLSNLESCAHDNRHIFVQGDIADASCVDKILQIHKPHAIIHFAAESHVDRSIDSADEFIQTNILGTYNLLQSARRYWTSLTETLKRDFRFIHISTDEVYGTLGRNDLPFTETSAYAPNNPYSASKASSDHLVRAFHHTYQLPIVTTNCSNNYGPYQFPEKLIPLTIHNAITGKKIPLYGDGQNIRDWIYVMDHCEAIRQVLYKGVVGSTYNIGGMNEKSNIAVVREICNILNIIRPGPRYESLIDFVKDRPGHDRRYAIDSNKIYLEIGWKPRENFASGLKKTVTWYLENLDWVSYVTSGKYRKWIDLQYESKQK